MDICLKSDASICHSEQVAEYLSQLILLFIEEQGSQVILKLDTSKIDLTISLNKNIKACPQTFKSVCGWPLCSLCIDLSVRFWYSFVILSRLHCLTFSLT